MLDVLPEVGGLRRIRGLCNHFSLEGKDILDKAILERRAVRFIGVEDRETRKIERLHGVFGEKAPLHGVSQAVAKGKRAQQGEIAIPRVGGDGGNHEGVDQGREVGGDVAKKWTDNTDHLFFRDERTQGLSGTGHGAL